MNRNIEAQETTSFEKNGPQEKFYGWIVAIAGACIIFSSCNFQYSFGVLLKPLADKFAWSRTAISGVISARSMTSALIAPIAGTLTDKYGPRRIVIVGVFFAGLGYLLSASITSLWQLYLFLSILMGIGLGTIYTPVISTVAKWFGSKAALANGIALSGFSLGQIAIPLIVTFLIVHHSWKTAFFTLALIAWVLGIIAWSFMKGPAPNETSLPPKESIWEDTTVGESLELFRGDYTLSAALHTRNFWLLFLIYLSCACCYQMVIAHIVADATDTGIDPQAAALILTMNGITTAVGRLSLGGLANKLGNKHILSASMAPQVIILFFLPSAGDVWTYYALALAFGLVYGGIGPVMNSMATELFGTRSIGSILGSLTIAYTCGVAIGPLLAGTTHDATGSYAIAFSIAAGIMALAFACSLFLRPTCREMAIDSGEM